MSNCWVFGVGFFVGFLGVFSFAFVCFLFFFFFETDLLTLPWNLSIFSWELGKQLLIYYLQDIEKYCSKG